MQAMAKQEVEFDVHAARAKARFAFDKDSPSSSSALADMQTKCAKGERTLKPAKGPHITYAVATAPAKFSRIPLSDRDMERSQIARVIYSMAHPMPSAIVWRNHPSPDAREKASQRFAQHLAELFEDRQPHIRHLARLMIKATLRQGGVAEPWNLSFISMHYHVWRNSGERRLWDEVNREINAIELTALQSLECRLEN